MEKIKEIDLSEFVFELEEDTKMECLVHFAAPFTGGDECVLPKGTTFIISQSMRDDAFFIDPLVSKEEWIKLKDAMREKIRTGEYKDLYPRYQGVSFFITEEQLKTTPIKFISGNKEVLLDFITYKKWYWNMCLRQMGRPKKYDDVSDDYSPSELLLLKLMSQS